MHDSSIQKHSTATFWFLVAKTDCTTRQYFYRIQNIHRHSVITFFAFRKADLLEYTTKYIKSTILSIRSFVDQDLSGGVPLSFVSTSSWLRSWDDFLVDHALTSENQTYVHVKLTLRVETQSTLTEKWKFVFIELSLFSSQKFYLLIYNFVWNNWEYSLSNIFCKDRCSILPMKISYSHSNNGNPSPSQKETNSV